MTLIKLVLFGIQLAGIGIERIEQPMQRATGHRREIWLFDIFGADAGENLAVHAELAVSAVIVVAGCVDT